jgi:hypothetical protein
MTGIDRRQGLAGAGALALAALAQGAAAITGAEVYDYLFLDLDAPAGTPPAEALAAQLRAEPLPAGGDVIGLFTPQLGWRAHQAALLLRWASGAPARETAVARLQSGAGVQRATRERLTATLRPSATDKPAPGGIYVHRWFAVDAAAVPEFLALSAEGWRDFEARFDTNIFGLLQAERTPQDRKSGLTRLLLITRYKDHGVWEASRDPSTAAMASFARRQKLTRETWGASTLLAAL